MYPVCTQHLMLCKTWYSAFNQKSMYNQTVICTMGMVQHLILSIIYLDLCALAFSWETDIVQSTVHCTVRNVGTAPNFCTAHFFMYSPHFSVQFTILYSCKIMCTLYNPQFCVQLTIQCTIHIFLYSPKFCVQHSI